MKRLLVLALLAGSTTLSGCIVAAAPLLAAGAIGKRQLDKKRDPDLPSSRAPVVALTPQAAPAGIPAGQAVPSGTTATNPAPPPGSVPPGMQYLYGSGEASAISIQAYLGLTDFLLARASDFQVGHPVQSVVMAPNATLAAPSFMTCAANQQPAVVLDIDETALMNLGYEADDSQRNGPYDQGRWDRWETSGVGAVDPVPGALEAIRAARRAGIQVVFNSNRSSATADSTVAALTLAGLGPVVHFQNLWLKGDGGTPGGGKDGRRWAISAKYCVIAMVGDQLGDFSDLFNSPELTVAQRRAATNSPMLRMLWGHGWFMLPNPVYGTALKGDIDAVFPANRRWTDPGPAIGAVPAPVAAPSPKP
ncbi:HAD family acid phosphatase [Sphingomonas sp.]|jgi:5'-nucleotidase (lipoprotein e(P4) family)|uniref:HAD family acid phosphatase n=1 Tax=Sphingomonas sp. TaxID=28214 RepID=UPI002E33D07A|nr:HAD family acid phosphatase [Sphingomonas sp.]HEX4694850.1 HAD family acid phosphatase [Sphingomonas sp.]